MTTDTDALLPKVMDLLLDLVCVVDRDGRYVYVNAACERVLGYRAAELIGRRMIELVHPNDRQRTIEAAERVANGYSHIDFENRYLRKDGGVVHLMWSARWSQADDVRLAVARDVTELRRTTGVRDALYLISEAAHAAEGLDQLYAHIHRIVGGLLPAANFAVVDYDRTTDRVSWAYHADEREPRPEPQPLRADTPIARVIRGKSALLVATGGGSGPGRAVPADGSGHPDWLGVPLVSHQGVIGALVVRSYCSDVRYSQADRSLLAFVSTQIATVIERKQAQTRMLHLAQHDPLTDLPNRLLFEDRVDVAIKRAHRDGELLGMLYLDLDDFKEVNDRFGHHAGDRLLQDIARRLQGCVRESDTVARMGGDEFTVLLTNIRTREDCTVVEAKLRKALAAPVEIEGASVSVSASIGAAAYPGDGIDADSLMRRADEGMYAAKRGRQSRPRLAEF
ncbi:MAG TPA: diguanylate cyclase [Gammaproteobacteria bacterium]|nr:diguanylate cyclase [Gammaproteobacteria bacterium]